MQFYIIPSEEDIILLGVDCLNKTKPQLNFKEQTIKFEERDDGIFESSKEGEKILNHREIDKGTEYLVLW
jgi:hypothetical protein